MTRLSSLAYEAAKSRSGYVVSFEAFPGRNEADLSSLTEMAKNLQEVRPSFLSVTYGAGGSTQDTTLATLRQLDGHTKHQLAGHLTCVGADKIQVNEVVSRYREIGVRRIVALRGDPPNGAEQYTPHPKGYKNAADLVGALAKSGDLDISVAAYPEVHPESASPQADIENLKAKYEAGASRGITQFFFDNTVFYRFLDNCQKHGIDMPMLPGILLIHDFSKVKNFARRCGAHIPEWLEARFRGLENDPEGHKLVAATCAAEQVLDLAAQGITQFHFYTLNKADLALATCRCLGILPDPPARHAA